MCFSESWKGWAWWEVSKNFEFRVEDYWNKYKKFCNKMFSLMIEIRVDWEVKSWKRRNPIISKGRDCISTRENYSWTKDPNHSESAD